MIRALITTLSVLVLIGGCWRSAPHPTPSPLEEKAEKTQQQAKQADGTAPVAERTSETAEDAADAVVEGGEPAVPMDFAAPEVPVDGEHKTVERLPAPDPERFPNLRQMAPQYDVWFDPENKQVVLQSGICLREGPLELFACIHQWVDDPFAPSGKMRRGTKEYESIVTVNTTAALVHAALLAAGAESGHPARFQPNYEPAAGSEIEITMHWKDAEGNWQQAPAQHWIRNMQSNEAMETPWVFGGSGFWVDESTGKREYMAENGNLVCVSNFSDAVLDLPVASPQDNESLLFEAFTERIPPMGTPVTLVLTPKSIAGQQASSPETAAQDSATRR